MSCFFVVIVSTFRFRARGNRSPFYFCQWPRRDSNPNAPRARDFKSPASANSATRPFKFAPGSRTPVKLALLPLANLRIKFKFRCFWHNRRVNVIAVLAKKRLPFEFYDRQFASGRAPSALPNGSGAETREPFPAPAFWIYFQLLQIARNAL